MIARFEASGILKILILFTVLTGCVSGSKTEYQGGVAISFDDHFIEEWHQLLPIFEKHKARATYFLTCPDTLSQREIRLLHEMEADGNEIGFHGTVHGSAQQLLESTGVQGYLNTEIVPGLRFMQSAGFSPTAYAHPGGNRAPQTDSVLLAQKFFILRDVAQVQRRLFGLPLYHIPPQFIPSVYYTYAGNSTVYALLIDVSANLNRSEIRQALLVAKKTKTVLMLFGHKPLYSKPKEGEYGFDVGMLEYILHQADSLDLRYYTMSELRTLGTQRP